MKGQTGHSHLLKLSGGNSDIKNGKNTTAIARLDLNENIKIDFNKTKKLSKL